MPGTLALEIVAQRVQRESTSLSMGPNLVFHAKQASIKTRLALCNAWNVAPIPRRGPGAHIVNAVLGTLMSAGPAQPVCPESTSRRQALTSALTAAQENIPLPQPQPTRAREYIDIVEIKGFACIKKSV